MTNGKYLRPDLDTLYTVALKNLEPRKTKDRTGSPQLEWLLTDGRRMYTPPIVAEHLKGIQCAQQFTIQKLKAGSGGLIDWQIRKPHGQPAAKILANTPSLDAAIPLETETPRKPAHRVTQLEDALKTAVAAAAAAEKHAEALGYSCRFSSADIRAMGISVLIGMTNKGRTAA